MARRGGLPRLQLWCQDKAVKEEVLRVGVLAGDGASDVIDRLHPGEGRTYRIKSLHRPIWKPEKSMPYEIRVEKETCNTALVVNAGGLR